MIKGLRDELRRYLPKWLADKEPTAPSWGFRLLWTIALFVDGAIDSSLIGSLASVAKGDAKASALKYLSDARGIVQGRVEADDAFVARLRQWHELLRLQGSQEGLVRQVQAYVGSVRVRVVNRAGSWVTINADGTLVRSSPPSLFDWDSVSNPERAGYWSEQWIIVYDPPYAPRGNVLGDASVLGGDGFGVGHLCPALESDTLRKIIAQWKAAHSYVRAVIWTTDAARFDPTDSLTWPNGNWGQWHIGAGPSDRDITDCRYWEFAYE